MHYQGHTVPAEELEPLGIPPPVVSPLKDVQITPGTTITGLYATQVSSCHNGWHTNGTHTIVGVSLWSAEARCNFGGHQQLEEVDGST